MPGRGKERGNGSNLLISLPQSSWRVTAMPVPGPGSIHGNINVPGVITAPLKTAWHQGKGAWTRCSTSSFFLRTRKRCSKQSPLNREIMEAWLKGSCYLEVSVSDIIITFGLAAKQWLVDFLWDLSLWRKIILSPRKSKFICLAYWSFRELDKFAFTP